jgi:uncharacterized membrane protein YfcA
MFVLQFAVTGFGSAIVFQIGWNLFDLLGILDPGSGFADGIMNLTLIGIIISGLQLFNLRHSMNWSLGCSLAVNRAIGHAIGAWLLMSLDDLNWLKRVLGVVFLLIAVQKCNKLRLSRRAKGYQAPGNEIHGTFRIDTWKTRLAITAAGLSAGFLAGLMGTGGPPIMVLLSFYPVPKDEYRPTAALMIVVGNAVGAVFMGHAATKPYFDVSLAPQYAVMVSGALVGLGVGNRAAEYVSQDQFGLIVLALLVFGSGLMLLAGTEDRAKIPPSIPIAAAVLLCVLFAGIFGMVWRSWYMHNRHQSSSRMSGSRCQQTTAHAAGVNIDCGTGVAELDGELSALNTAPGLSLRQGNSIEMVQIQIHRSASTSV